MQFKIDEENTLKLQKIFFEKMRYKTILKQICDNADITSLENKIYFLKKVIELKEEENRVISQIVNKYAPEYKKCYYDFTLENDLLSLKGV